MGRIKGVHMQRRVAQPSALRGTAHLHVRIFSEISVAYCDDMPSLWVLRRVRWRYELYGVPW